MGQWRPPVYAFFAASSKSFLAVVANFVFAPMGPHIMTDRDAAIARRKVSAAWRDPYKIPIKQIPTKRLPLVGTEPMRLKQVKRLTAVNLEHLGSKGLQAAAFIHKHSSMAEQVAFAAEPQKFLAKWLGKTDSMKLVDDLLRAVLIPGDKVNV